jgi:Acyl-CoA dehydrogenase, N-terminal domain
MNVAVSYLAKFSTLLAAPRPDAALTGTMVSAGPLRPSSPRWRRRFEPSARLMIGPPAAFVPRPLQSDVGRDQVNLLKRFDRSWETEELRMYRDMVRRFVDREIAPNSQRWRNEHRVEAEVWRSAGAAGVLCPAVPIKYGGGGAPFAAELVVIEELARALETGWGFGVHSSVVADYVTRYGTDEQRERWLPGMAAGTLIGAIAMTERLDGEVVVDGRSVQGHRPLPSILWWPGLYGGTTDSRDVCGCARPEDLRRRKRNHEGGHRALALVRRST